MFLIQYMSIGLIWFFLLYQIILKWCNLKEMKCKNHLLFFVIDDMITQEKIQKLLLLFFFFVGGGGGGINCQSS